MADQPRGRGPASDGDLADAVAALNRAGGGGFEPAGSACTAAGKEEREEEEEEGEEMEEEEEERGWRRGRERLLTLACRAGEAVARGAAVGTGEGAARERGGRRAKSIPPRTQSRTRRAGRSGA